MKNKLLNLKPTMRFQHSDDLDVTCHAILAGPDGKFTNFDIDRELAYIILFELVHHLRRQEKEIADAPKELPDSDHPLPHDDVPSDHGGSQGAGPDEPDAGEDGGDRVSGWRERFGLDSPSRFGGSWG